jgi:hypothetical protein
MKITRISAFQMDHPQHEGRYAWSGGRSATEFNGYVTKSIADGVPQRCEGTMQAASRPGGLAGVLGETVLVFE